MPLSKHKFALVGALGVAALGLVGVGTGATFTDSVHAQQSVQAGTLNMTVTGPDGSTVSTDGKTVTLKAFGPTNSTFTTGPQLVTTTNSGDITASAIQLSASHGGSDALASEVYVEIDSWSQPNQQGSLLVAYNGPLSGLESSPVTIQGDVPKGDTDPFYVTYYAGANGQNTDAAAAANGTSIDNAASLDDSVEGATLTPTITVSYVG